MKRLIYYFQTVNRYAAPITDHHFTLRCQPRMNATQNVQSASVLLCPDANYALRQDAFGNLLQIGCLREAHSHFTYTAVGELEVNHALSEREPLHPMYRYPSRLTQPTPTMEGMLDSLPPGISPLDRALMLCAWVHERLAYTPGATTVETTASEALSQGMGVCQDYAHALVALLRRAGIPARYACGLCVGEGETHAWVQAYLDGAWVGLDPTRNHRVTEEYVTFAVGRDASDCPLDRGVYVGGAEHEQQIYMRLTEQ